MLAYLTTVHALHKVYLVQIVPLAVRQYWNSEPAVKVFFCFFLSHFRKAMFALRKVSLVMRMCCRGSAAPVAPDRYCCRRPWGSQRLQACTLSCTTMAFSASFDVLARYVREHSKLLFPRLRLMPVLQEYISTKENQCNRA